LLVEAEKASIDGLLVIRLGRSGRDERGVVREFFRASDFRDELGLQLTWQQINVTQTVPGAVRGLHGEPMTKLVGLAWGEALGAYVDARSDSATFGQVCTVRLEVGTRVVVPRGVCNGFQSTGPGPSVYLYAFDGEWQPGIGAAVNPVDESLGFEWPVPVDATDRRQISAKDAGLPRFRDVYGVDPVPPA
jgi:dTDP-4-dehydrorhamnose 3,5-epimerase